MAQDLPFEPFSFISDPHHQTILGSYMSFGKEPKSITRVVQLADGDRITAEINTPKGWKGTDLTVLFVHGLCGSHQSPYLIRLVSKLEPMGIKCVRFNMRNCGSGKFLAKNTYHAGRSDDLFEVLKLLKIENPESPVVLVGFSLGGNLSLKLAGELGSLGKEYLKGVIGVCPPVDLHASIQRVGDPKNRLYEKYFSKLLRAGVYELHDKFRDLPRLNLPRDIKLYEFDQLYVVPTFGFKDTADYYGKCSSATLIDEISIPCKILFSKDDPIIAHSSLDSLRLPSNISLYKTDKGGHMGYLASPASDKGFYWLDSLVTDWILGM